MFYIGGDVVCTMDWDFNKIGDILREAARVPSDGPRSRHDQHPSDWQRSLHEVQNGDGER